MTVKQFIGRSILYTFWLVGLVGMAVLLPIMLVHMIIYFDHLAVKAMASIVMALWLLVIGAGLA